MASGLYNYFLCHTMDAEYNLGNGQDTIKTALLDNSHSFTATDDAWADVSANELGSGSGYTTGGETLANQSVAIDDVHNEGVFDGDDEAWTSASFSAYHAVLYDDTHGSDALIGSIDFGGIQTVTAGTFTISWAAEGIVNFTAA